VFFIHHQEPQPGKGHVFLEKTMGADQQIHLAFGGIGEDASLTGGGDEAGDRLHPQGEPRQAPFEGAMMLLSQDRGGHEERRLSAPFHGLEHRPKGHLGLPEPHISHHQSVHGVVVLHVFLYVPDGPELILRLSVGKGVFHHAQHFAVGGEGHARRRLPEGIEVRQLLGGFCGSLSGSLYGLAPPGTRKGVRSGLFFRQSGKRSHLAKLGHRYQQTFALGELQHEVVLLSLGGFHPLGS